MFKSRKIILIVVMFLVLLLVGLVVHVFWINPLQQKSHQEQLAQYREAEYVDNNVSMGIISALDPEQKKITLNDELGKGQQDIYVTEKTTILKIAEAENKYIQADFSALAEKVLVRAITNQVTKDQERIEAWDLYIIGKKEE